jgi:uncharacterized protein (TIGR03435 family)
MARICAVSILIVLLGVSSTFTQDSPPKFEVVSVRALPPFPGLPPGFAANPRRTGNRLTWTTRVYDLTLYAHNLPAWRVSGIAAEPSYVAITATFDAKSTTENIRVMLRQLLVERFKFAAHMKSEQRSGYAMTVAKNGPKLQTATADGAVPAMPPYLASQPPGPFEGFIFTSAEDGCCAITGRGVPMSRLAAELSSQLGAFVTDQTGLNGSYYFGFKFRRLDHLDTDAADAPSAFVALENELGLTLKPTIGPVDFLVVDHVQKVPTEN